MERNCFPLPGALQLGIQLSILWACGSILLLKKWRHEDPKRRWSDFVLDSLKQLAGACWVHLWSAQVDGCTEHLAGVMVGTTLGVLLQFVLLSIFTRQFENGSANPRAFRTGEYYTLGGRFVPGAFVIQLLLWLACVTAAECVMPLVTPPFVAACGNFLRVFTWFPQAELLFVSLVAPCGMYAFQAWVTDDFLKKDGAPGVFWQCARKCMPRSLGDFVQETLVNVDPLPLLPPPAPLSQQWSRQNSGSSVRSKVSTLARKISGAFRRSSSEPKSDSYEPPVEPAALPGPAREDHGHGVMSLLEEAEAPAAEPGATSTPPPVGDGAVDEARALALRAMAAQEAVAAAAKHLEAAETSPSQTNPHRLKELLRQREEELKDLHRQLERLMATEDAAHKHFSEALSFAEVLATDGEASNAFGDASNNTFGEASKGPGVPAAASVA